MAPKGTLVAIGGNEDKADDMTILRRTIEAVRGQAKNAVVVAAASRDPREAARPYLRAFEDLGLEHVDALDVRSRSEADDERSLRRLREADIIYLTGGDQAKLADTLRGTKALDVMRERYEGGAVIAGTSAGAAAMSATMIVSGRAEEGLSKGNVRTDKGLGLLPGVVVDTHFIQRGRFSRLLETIAHHPDLLGIGIAEDTAFIVRQGRSLEVVGSDNVIVVDGREIEHTNAPDAHEGEPMTVHRAIVHALADGCWFDIERRESYSTERAQREVPV